MTYLVHTSHAQLAAHWLGFVGWTFIAVAVGSIQWRVWQVSDIGVITSGKAWVGIWRVCFNSHTLVTPEFKVMYCRSISLTDTFTPPEIAAAQVLMLLALIVGLCGNAGSIYALRNVYLGLDKSLPIRSVFAASGALCLLAAAMSLVPLLWNLSSVVTNKTVRFPPDFHMPEVPEEQYVGSSIGLGIIGAALMTTSGVIFLTYRLPARSRHRTHPSLREQVHPEGSASPGHESGTMTNSRGRDNPAFESHEHS
ncbi:claudin-34-like [Myripristis murdjan]|uniref:claudin-34-like n=1 Tax=Myripristis murdjan TaxID=586833 RepID=UPI001175DE9D|nr:claudin-34-like [Myripristis murdjan]